MFYEIKYKNSVGEEVHFKAEKKGNLFVAPDKPSVLSSGNPYRLMMFEGLGEVAAEMHLNKSFAQDGSTHSSTVLSERHPYLQFVLVGKDWEDLSRIRRQATRVFNPKSKGTLEFSYGANSYVLKVIPESLPVYSQEDTSGKTQVASVSLVAPDPYWQSAEEYSEEIVTWIGGLTFPLELPTGFATAGEQIINVINYGDVETPVTIRIEGKATNPKITNTLTGEYIRVNRIVESGEILEITTGFGDKKVKLEGTSVFHYIDLDSTFFSLNVGDNVIELTTDDLSDSAKISIAYKYRYLGV